LQLYLVLQEEISFIPSKKNKFPLCSRKVLYVGQTHEIFLRTC
jgi:hypothetical protein